MSDNFAFDITGAPLAKCLDIAVSASPNRKAVAWHVDKDGKRLVLHWAIDSKGIPLPAALDGDALRAFVEAWLEAVNYGPEPDHDGHNGRGCRVYNESWGQVDGEWSAFVAIEPAWLMYGK